MKTSIYQKYIKRLTDILLSVCGLIVLSPVFLALAVLIYIDDPGPVFFKQRRVGKGKGMFTMVKFRSMKICTPHDIPTHLMKDPEQYITRIGRFLRMSSLDELPQIWNILKGDMSIIGPRPALWNQEDLIAERDLYGVNDVVPGLTGWAQVNGRDELEIPEKVRLDREYCQSITFKMDAKCFLMTIVSVLGHRGVVEGGTGTMEEHMRDEKDR